MLPLIQRIDRKAQRVAGYLWISIGLVHLIFLKQDYSWQSTKSLFLFIIFICCYCCCYLSSFGFLEICQWGKRGCSLSEMGSSHSVKNCWCTSDDVIIQSVLHPGQGFSSCSSVGNQLQTETRGNSCRTTNLGGMVAVCNNQLSYYLILSYTFNTWLTLEIMGS